MSRYIEKKYVYTVPEKTFWIIGGINGVGKSTFTADQSVNYLGRIIDPDAFAAETGNVIAGGRKALEEINCCIKKGITFCQETTLSSRQIVNTIKMAKEYGYRISMVYIGLNSADESIERVANRVAAGGHYIPDDIIRRRFKNRFIQLERVLFLCDTARFYDNTHGFELIAEYYENKMMELNNNCKWLSEFISYFIGNGGEMWL